jgi:hypothetical protein
MKTRPPPVVLYLKTQCNLKYQINLFFNLKIIIVKKIFLMMVLTITLFTSCGTICPPKTLHDHIEYGEAVQEAKEGFKVSQAVASTKLQEALLVFDNDVAQKVDDETKAKDWQAAWKEFQYSIDEQKIAFNEVEIAQKAYYEAIDSLDAKMKGGTTMQKRSVNQTSIDKQTWNKEAQEIKKVFADFDRMIIDGSDFELALIGDAMRSKARAQTAKIREIGIQGKALFKQLEGFTNKTNSVLGSNSVESRVPVSTEVTASVPATEPSTSPESIGNYVSQSAK